MVMIVTQVARDAGGLRDAFIAANRDYFPPPVYDYLFDHLTENADGEFVKLDVVGLCGDITALSLNETEFADLQELAASLDNVIYTDAETNTVYYWAY